METKDVFVYAYGAGLVAQSINATQQEAAEKIAYSNMVAGLMAQGLSIEEAHSKVQDFYAEQAEMQRRIAAPIYAARRRSRNKVIAFGVGIVVLLVGIALYLGRPGTVDWCEQQRVETTYDSKATVDRYVSLCSKFAGKYDDGHGNPVTDPSGTQIYLDPYAPSTSSGG